MVSTSKTNEFGRNFLSKCILYTVSYDHVLRNGTNLSGNVWNLGKYFQARRRQLLLFILFIFISLCPFKLKYLNSDVPLAGWIGQSIQIKHFPNHCKLKRSIIVLKECVQLRSTIFGWKQFFWLALCVLVKSLPLSRMRYLMHPFVPSPSWYLNCTCGWKAIIPPKLSVQN